MFDIRSVPLKMLVEEFQLEVVFAATDYDMIRLTVEDVARPGLQLAGYFDHFEPMRLLVMGNVDPAGQFRLGTPDSVRSATLAVMEKCCGHPNFLISSGCDIPPATSWGNIDAFFRAVEEFYDEGK